MATDFEELQEKLKMGFRVSDTQFDKIFPSDLRSQARLHWTSVAVALEATQLLTAGWDPGEGVQILDVGSGAGKFCFVGALASAAHFTGIEQRKTHVDAARSVARSQRIPRVRFRCCDLEAVDWGIFHGFYLFNPFYEHINSDMRVDQAVSFSQSRYEKCVEIVQQKLSACRPGTRVVTYYGFGGPLPSSYRKEEGLELSPHLELWTQE